LDTSKSLLKYYGIENYLPQQVCEAILYGDSSWPSVSEWYAKYGAVPLMDSLLNCCPSRQSKPRWRVWREDTARYIRAGRNVTGSATADAHCRVTQSGEL
jgi:hypothetical protein